MILATTRKVMDATGISFINETAQGSQVVRIELRNTVPKVTLYCVSGGKVVPLTITFPEIIEFVQVAELIWSSRYSPVLATYSQNIFPRRKSVMQFVTKPVKSGGKEVGTVQYPEFDEANPAVGLGEIQSFDWSQYGYKSWQEAVVRLVNTQHATNIKNRYRAEKSGRLTEEQINQLALKEVSDEITSLTAAKDSGDAAAAERLVQIDVRNIAGFSAYLQQKKVEIKTRLGLNKSEEDENEEGSN